MALPYHSRRGAGGSFCYPADIMGHDRNAHATTRQAVPPAFASGQVRVPTLTIACHPDPARVGHRYHLAGHLSNEASRVARLEPVFSTVAGVAIAPLNDPFISRKPIHFAPLPGGGVEITRGASSTLLEVEGRGVTDRIALAPEAIDAGVTVVLGQRIVLVLRRRALPEPLPAVGARLIGGSDEVFALRRRIGQVADLDVPVLIRGESGSGKELVARAIHDGSPRRRGPFVAVNMAAVPPSTAASELFGHVRGAFTGAVRDHAGHFERASGGTLFLDEVGETPSEIQAMLLRALESGTILPVGASGPKHVDVRLVAATDADLDGAVAAGTFRLPLLHRLSGYTIPVPPLRERREDVGRLLLHFLEEELTLVGEAERLERPGAEPWLPAWLVERLVRHPWPGNVRQLRNVVRQLVISSRGAGRMTVDPAVEALLAVQPKAPPPQAAPAVRTSRAPADIGDAELVAALRANGWKVGPTARALGIARSSLYLLIDRSRSIRKARDVSAEEIAAARAACDGSVQRMAEQLEVSARGLKLRMTELGL